MSDILAKLEQRIEQRDERMDRRLKRIETSIAGDLGPNGKPGIADRLRTAEKWMAAREARDRLTIKMLLGVIGTTTTGILLLLLRAQFFGG